MSCVVLKVIIALNIVIYFYPRCEYSTRPKAEEYRHRGYLYMHYSMEECVIVALTLQYRINNFTMCLVNLSRGIARISRKGGLNMIKVARAKHVKN